MYSLRRCLIDILASDILPGELLDSVKKLTGPVRQCTVCANRGRYGESPKGYRRDRMDNLHCGFPGSGFDSVYQRNVVY